MKMHFAIIMFDLYNFFTIMKCIHAQLNNVFFKTKSYLRAGATAVSPPPFFMIDYDRKFHADSEKYKNITLKINGKCSNSTSKF